MRKSMSELDIKLNSEWKEEQIKTFLSSIQDNRGYCPCRLDRIPETKCPCEEFRNQDFEGECYCGLFVKVSK